MPVEKWKNKIHSFVQNELVQWEIEAEMNRGEIPAEASIKHRKIAIDMGLPGMDAPKEKGGLGLSMLDQVVIWEELGKVTNALCWCFSEAQSWMYEACSDEQIKNYINPLLRGEKKECYAITESESGSNVDGGINTTAILDGDFYILNGEKWYVTGANKADFLFVQAKIGKGKNKDKHVLFLLDKDTKGLELLSSPLFSHTYSFHHPTYKLNNIKVPVKNLIGKEGDGLKYTYSWDDDNYIVPLGEDSFIGKVLGAIPIIKSISKKFNDLFESPGVLSDRRALNYNSSQLV